MPNVIDQAAGGDPELHQLRRRRNVQIYLNPVTPNLTIDQQMVELPAPENEAREAVKAVFRVLYANPWV